MTLPCRNLGAEVASSTTLLRHGEQALKQGDRKSARFCLGLLEESSTLGAAIAAAILAEALDQKSGANIRSAA